MVRRILLDERYTGVLIQGKTTTPNHKVKVVIHKEEAEWIRYENAFEPVINRHQYEVVGNLMKMDTMRGAKGLALLSGLVKCGDCKESMVLKSPVKSTTIMYVRRPFMKSSAVPIVSVRKNW